MHKGRILKDLIKKSPYTQKKVAEGVDIDEKYFSVLLKNSEVKYDVIRKVCEFLGVDMEKYFSDDPFIQQDDYMTKYIDAMEKLTKSQEELLACKAELMTYKSKVMEYEMKFGKLETN